MSLVLAIAVAVLIWWALFVPIFGGVQGFIDCLRENLLPDFRDWFSDGHGNWWQDMKLYIWLLLGALGGLAVFAALGGA